MKNKITKELEEIAPNLASMDKANPFKVPEGYFNSLGNRTLDALDKKPLLETSAPAGYFDNLPDKILEQVKSEKKTKVISFNYKKWISVAAAFIIIFSARYLINSPSDSSDQMNEFAFEIDPEEALNYLIETDELQISDLISLDIYDSEQTTEGEDMPSLDDSDLDDLLNTLNQEELEELL